MSEAIAMAMQAGGAGATGSEHEVRAKVKEGYAAIASASSANCCGPKVGASGRAVGVDMTGEMPSRAPGEVAAYRARTGLDNVEFRLGEIEHLPVADASVDVVISNCVVNLSPDKAQDWREIGRVLRPGGRVAVSHIALLEPPPA